MTHGRRSVKLACIWLMGLLFCLCSTVAFGYPLEGVFSDPPARAHAEKLSQTLAKGSAELENPEYRKLFVEDPNLSKRAFVAVIDQMMETFESHPDGIETLASFAMQLALLIEQEFGDSQPREILTAIADEQRQEEALENLFAYFRELKPQAQSASQDEDEVPEIDLSAYDQEKVAEAFLPFWIKMMRIQYATTLVSPELIISELDTYPFVEKSVEQALIALGFSPEEARIDPTGDVARALALRKLVVQAEIGLLDDFEKAAQRLLEKEEDAAEATFVHMTGFRAAYRQQRTELAEKFLLKAKSTANFGGIHSDPLVQYCLRTADHQLRRLKGHHPKEQELLEEALTTWSVLDGYQATARLDEAYYWYYGRQATRYWIDELRSYSASLGRYIAVTSKLLTEWAVEMSAFNPMERLSSGDVSEESFDIVFGYAALSIATFDQLLYSAEAIVELSPVEGFNKLVTDVDEVADGFAAVQKDFEVLSEGEGFPPFQVAEGGLVSELRARARYLKALEETTPVEQRPDELRQAAVLIRKTKNPELTVDYLLKVGEKLAAYGQDKEAVLLWKEALSLADELSFVQRGLDAASLLAKEYSRRGDWANAAVYAERGNDKIQATAPMVGVHSPEGQLLAQKTRELTAISVKAAAESDEPEKALAVLTRSQQVESAAVQMEGRKEAQAQARDVLAKEGQVVALVQEVKRLEAMPASETRNSLLESTQGLLANTRAEFLSRSRELRQKYSDLYTKVLRYDPLNLPEIQKSLPSDLAVVQYFPTDDALYIFLVTQKSFRLRSVPLSQQALESSVQSYLRAIRNPGTRDAILAAEGAKLYKALVAPVEEDIAHSNTLVLIPSGRLNSLPFSSLSATSGVPLGQDKEIIELAKSTDLIRMSGDAPKPISSLVAFANATGDLPAAAKEGEEIARLFPSSEVKLFKGKEATREAFVKFGGQADALHLATHGEWNTEDSLDNYLAMANQQRVSQDEIFELGLDNTSIVILSACNTAMGDGGDVKYVASLAEAFWIAGSRSVLASLWAVDDESTALLMTEFYKALKSGDSKAKALKKAQAAVRSQAKFAHPYYWSGFILFGDWR